MFRVMYSSGSLCHQAMDFAIEGLLPCQFGRIYRSNQAANGPLGYGWYWPWDIKVSLEGEEIVYRAMGGLVEEHFRLEDAFNGSIRSKTASTLFLSQDEVLLNLPSNRIYHFAFPTRFQPVGPLQSIQDLSGNAIHCVNWEGRLREMTDASGRHYRVVRDLEQRITGIDLEGGVPSLPRRLVSYEYDWRGDLIRVIDRCGAESEYRYNEHLMVALRNRSGGWYYAEYDSSHHCIRTWRSDGRLTKTYRHDPVRRQLLIHDAAGYGTLIRLDEESRLLDQIDPVGVKTTMVYDQRGSLAGTMSNAGLSSTVSVIRNDQKSETRMSGADGCEYTITTDPATRQEVIANCVGAKWKHQYDERGNLAEITTPMGGVYRYEYDARGQLAAASTASGNRLQYLFSADYRRLEVVDAVGLVGTLRWDEEGRLVSRQMPECNAEEYRYDGLGRVTEIVRPNGASLQFRLDPEGNTTTAITETGDARDAEWSPFSELLSGLDGLGTRFWNGYDELGRLVLVTNATDESTRMEYDAAGRFVSQIFFDGSAERYTYDERGSLSAILYPDGSSKKFEFDAAGRVTGASDEEHALRLEYDPRGLPLTTVRDGVTVRYEYDLEGWPVLEVQDGVAMAREFDVAGNCVSLTVEGLGVRRLEYDARGRLVRMSDFNQDKVRWVYDLRDRVRSISVGAELGLEYEYLAESRIERTRIWNASASAEARYVYDRAGRIASRRGPGTEVIGFGYRQDGFLGRISGNGGAARVEEYTTNGDLTQDAAGREIDYAEGGRVRKVGDRAYEYDGRGRVVGISQGDEKLKLTYDHLDGLIRADSASRGTAEYRYDAMGRRTGKVTGSGATRFLWDGEWLLAEFGSDSGQKRTYAGPAWRTLRMSADGADGKAELWLTDLNGLPLAAATATDLVVANGSDVWGRAPNAPAEIAVRLAGQYEDGETGLYYNGYRYYDPLLRRYLTPDPLRLVGAVNLYAYQTDPVNSIDPRGLATVTAKPCENQGPVYQKHDPPATKDDDPGCSQGNSIHNDCITMARDRARQPGPGGPGYNTRADQSMTTGTGRNRPDLALTKPGQQNVYIEWDNPPCSRAQDHYNKICAGDPGAMVYLVELNTGYGPGGASAGGTTQGTRSPKAQMGKGANLSPADCGIDDINTDLSARGMTPI